MAQATSERIADAFHLQLSPVGIRNFWLARAEDEARQGRLDGAPQLLLFCRMGSVLLERHAGIAGIYGGRGQKCKVARSGDLSSAPFALYLTKIREARL
jgi:hypothetical protein